MKRLFLLLALGWAAAMIGCTAETATTPTADASSETPEITITTPDSEVAAATRLISLNVPNMT